MDILKDKVLLCCLLVALMVTGFLFYKKLPLIIPPQGKIVIPEPSKVSEMAAKADKIHEMAIVGKLSQTPAGTPKKASDVEDISTVEITQKNVIAAETKAMDDALPVEPVSSLHPPPLPPSTPHLGSSSGAPQQVPSQAVVSPYADKLSSLQKSLNPNPDQIHIKKSRPRLGTNEWLVGPGAGADSMELEPVLKNVIDGDIVTVSPGVYEFSFSMIGGSVEIIGKEGVSFKFKKSFTPVMAKSISLRDIKLEFDPEDSYTTIMSPMLTLNLDNIRISEEVQTISLNRGVKIIVKNSHFSGTTFTFWDMAEAHFENCFFEKGRSFLSLYGSSKVKVNKSQLMNFSGNAITSHSYLTKFEAEQIKISSGTSAFFGKFSEENTSIRESEFKNLSYFTMQPETKIKCSICQKTNIKN